jgi:hypothetical protein
MPRIVTDAVCPLSSPHYRTKPSPGGPHQGSVEPRLPAVADLCADYDICPDQAPSRPLDVGPWLQPSRPDTYHPVIASGTHWPRQAPGIRRSLLTGNGLGAQGD